MGRVDGKVALITGAARGQGRSHALALAREGADILAVDICRQIDSVPYALASSDDLKVTQKAVEATGRRCVAVEADVRDATELAEAVSNGTSELGPVGIVIANAGVAHLTHNAGERDWQDSIDVNLTGTMNTVEAVVPSMIERGEGGSIVLISSTGGLRGILDRKPGMLAYVASKHGVVGLMRTYANVLAQHSIRVNTIHPGGVATPMVTGLNLNETLEAMPQLLSSTTNPMPVEMIPEEDISRAVLYLVSDDGRWVTGMTMSVDGGFVNKIG